MTENVILPPSGAKLTLTAGTLPKSLDERLADVALPDGQASKTAISEALKSIRDEAIGLLPFGGAVAKILAIHDDIASKLTAKKKDLLIEGALNRLDAQGDGLSKLVAFVTNPYGSTLLSKVLQIAGDYPPDEELLAKLSGAIAFMAETDFTKLFSQHKYSLALIERLTPQALSVLGTYRDWPLIDHAPLMSQGGRSSADWHEAAAKQLAVRYGISDAAGVNRLKHVFHELERDGLLFGNSGELGGKSCVQITLEDVGRDLVPYLTDPREGS